VGTAAVDVSAAIIIKPASTTTVATVIDDHAGKTDLGTYLTLKATAPVTVDLWVY